MPEPRIDVTGLWGAVEGYAIGALESPRASITTLSRHFGFDAVETEGVIRFVMRGRAAVASVTHDDLVAPNAGSGARDGDVLELTRAQETELPQALKGRWRGRTRITTPPWLRRGASPWTRRGLPRRAFRWRSRLRKLNGAAAARSWKPGPVGRQLYSVCRPRGWHWIRRTSCTLVHDGRQVPLRLVSIADAEARGIEAVRQDREAHDLPPGVPRPSSLSKAVVFGAPEALLLDLPQLTEDQPAHRPLIAAHGVPWPGEMAVFRSPSTDGFELLTTFGACQDRDAGLGFLPGPDLALRSRQCAGGRSAEWHAGEHYRPYAIRWCKCARHRDRVRCLGNRPGGHSRPDRARPAIA